MKINEHHSKIKQLFENLDVEYSLQELENKTDFVEKLAKTFQKQHINKIDHLKNQIGERQKQKFYEEAKQDFEVKKQEDRKFLMIKKQEYVDKI